jgi:hypothetical protein
MAKLFAYGTKKKDIQENILYSSYGYSKLYFDIVYKR